VKHVKKILCNKGLEEPEKPTSKKKQKNVILIFFILEHLAQEFVSDNDDNEVEMCEEVNFTFNY